MMNNQLDLATTARATIPNRVKSIAHGGGDRISGKVGIAAIGKQRRRRSEEHQTIRIMA